MNRILLVAALGLFLAQISRSEEPTTEPLACPHCGTWPINAASPSGAAGEDMVISSGHASLPGCGEFGITTTEIKHSAQDRTYTVTLELKPLQTERLCTAVDPKSLRLRAAISVGYIADGSFGQFTLSGMESAQPIYSAMAWNYARYSPCDTGSAYGSIACTNYGNAKLIKALAYESQEVYSGRQPAGQFNPARFAAATLNFCLNREANRGGGSWPSYWAIDCQHARLQTKLAELREWSACRTQKKQAKCKPPDETFDKSPRTDD